tara:strand:- start:3544 stop:4449 length:906 start_codon:yes stop_codon:yes gene_type:complete
MKDSILVLGGSGFIGQHFINLALKKNYNVTLLSLNKKKYNYIKKIKYIYCDISNFNQLKKKIKNKNFDYIINFSGYVDHSSFFNDGKSIINSHFIGLVNILSLINKKKLKKILQIGTSDEYDENTKGIDENYNIKLLTPYSFSKFTTLNFLKMLYFAEKLKFTYVRLFLVYGPGQQENRLIPYVIKKCIKNERFSITNKNKIRDFLYIDDATEALIKLLISPKTSGKIYNLASGDPVPLDTIIKIIIKKICGGKVVYGTKESKKEYKNLYADITKIYQDIKWKPKTNIGKGINKTINFYQK